MCAWRVSLSAASRCLSERSVLISVVRVLDLLAEQKTFAGELGDLRPQGLALGCELLLVSEQLVSLRIEISDRRNQQRKMFQEVH